MAFAHSVQHRLRFLVQLIKRAKSGVAMQNDPNRNTGLKLLIRKCRNQFRRSENLDYYQAEDYKDAERKYVKHCLLDEIRT